MIEQVVSWQGMNLECIVVFKLDVVLVWCGGNVECQVNQLQFLGIYVLWVQILIIEEIIVILCELVQWSLQLEKVQQVVQVMQQEYDVLKVCYVNVLKKCVFLQFGFVLLFISGFGLIQDQVLRFCGGENIFVISCVFWLQVSCEQVLVCQLQVIVVIGDVSCIVEVQCFW